MTIVHPTQEHHQAWANLEFLPRLAGSLPDSSANLTMLCEQPQTHAEYLSYWGVPGRPSGSPFSARKSMPGKAPTWLQNRNYGTDISAIPCGRAHSSRCSRFHTSGTDAFLLFQSPLFPPAQDWRHHSTLQSHQSSPATTRNLKKFEIEIPLDRGLHAITGPNGTGKSTIMALLSKPFQPNILRNRISTKIQDGAKVTYSLDSSEEVNTFIKGVWATSVKGKPISLSGFFEGSVIHGTRFWDANYKAIQNATKLTSRQVV